MARIMLPKYHLPMAIPEALRGMLRDPAFWETYLMVTEGAIKIPDVVVEFDVGDGHHIVLDVQGRFESYELGIRTPASPDVLSIGWNDWAHWHPYALRWDELDLVCRAIAAVDSSLPHPGAALSLLGSFVSVQEGDDVDMIMATVRTAFDSLRSPDGDGGWPDMDKWLEYRDFRGHGVTWTRDDAGHLYASQGDDAEFIFYSMRGQPTGDPHDFPYGSWRALLAQAGRTLHIDAA